MDYYDPPLDQTYIGNVKLNDDNDNDEFYQLEITDKFSINDQDSFILRDEWIKQSMGFILMYSITSRESFNKIKEYKELIQLIFDCIYDNDNISNIPPILLIGNKSDEIIDIENRQVSYQEGKELSISLGISSFIEVSSKSNNLTKNINQSKFEIVGLINNHKHLNNNINIIKQNNKSKCKLM